MIIIELITVTLSIMSIIILWNLIFVEPPGFLVKCYVKRNDILVNAVLWIAVLPFAFLLTRLIEFGVMILVPFIHNTNLAAKISICFVLLLIISIKTRCSTQYWTPYYLARLLEDSSLVEDCYKYKYLREELLNELKIIKLHEFHAYHKLEDTVEQIRAINKNLRS